MRRTVVGLATLVLLAAAPLAAQAPAPAGLPDSPAGRALGEWLAAYDSGDRAAMLAFAASHYAPADLARRPAEMIATRERWRFVNLGAIEVVHVDTASDTLVAATIRLRRTGSWGHLDARVEPAPPHRVRAIDFAFYTVPPALEHATVTGVSFDSATARALDAYVAGLARDGVFSGTVLVARDGRPVFQRAYGWADAARRAPNAIDTQFDLASVGKMFTAVAVAQLVEQGKLSYDDTLATLLPDFPNRDAARRITVRHLLTMSSGLADFMMHPAFDSARRLMVRPTDLYPLFASDSLRFAPGERFEYCNSNFLLLGAIVERVSGEPYRDYYRRHVFAPAGMTATWTEDRPHAATGYTHFGPMRRVDPEGTRVVDPAEPSVGSPAGGGLSTAGDLLRFVTALQQHRLLGAAALDTLLAPRRQSFGESTRTAYGFDVERWGPLTILGHDGYGFGAYTDVGFYPDLGYTVVVLANVDTWGTGAVVTRIREMMIEGR